MVLSLTGRDNQTVCSKKPFPFCSADGASFLKILSVFSSWTAREKICKDLLTVFLTLMANGFRLKRFWRKTYNIFHRTCSFFSLSKQFQVVSWESFLSTSTLAFQAFHYLYYNTACISQEVIELLYGHLHVTHEAVDLFCRYESVDMLPDFVLIFDFCHTILFEHQPPPNVKRKNHFCSVIAMKT